MKSLPLRFDDSADRTAVKAAIEHRHPSFSVIWFGDRSVIDGIVFDRTTGQTRALLEVKRRNFSAPYLRERYNSEFLLNTDQYENSRRCAMLLASWVRIIALLEDDTFVIPLFDAMGNSLSRVRQKGENNTLVSTELCAQWGIPL